MRAVLLEHTRRRKFAELMSNHILSNKNGVKRFAVVNEKRMANKIRRDHRAARPGFDRFFPARAIHLIDLLEKMRFDERSFFQ